MFGFCNIGAFLELIVLNLQGGARTRARVRKIVGWIEHLDGRHSDDG